MLGCNRIPLRHPKRLQEILEEVYRTSRLLQMPTPGEVEATEAKGGDQGIFIPVRYFNYLKLSVDSSLRALNFVLHVHLVRSVSPKLL